MSTTTRIFAVLAVTALAVGASQYGCTAGHGPERLVCETAEDCDAYEFPSDCDPEFGGDWICEQETCLPLCFECNGITDCDNKIWQGDPPTCPLSQRYFDCVDSFCEHLCATQCDHPSDCADVPWPTDAGCEEDAGHWECNQGECVTVCDACTDAADCEAANPEFPKCCEGHWECIEGTCEAICDLGCETAADCVGQPWPEYLECTEAQGRWDCVGCECEGSCVSNCEVASECLNIEWDEDCEGHWSCDAGWCTPHCGETCGDDECVEADGESAETCPADCGAPCEDAEDCTDRPWGLPCQGRFECDDGDCVRMCDYSTCGADGCRPAQGESAASCPDDCLEGCETPADCFDEPWNLLECPTGGTHTCLGGTCGQVCSPASCPNGVCEPELSMISGESGNSCAADCGAGYCTTPSDCHAYVWTVDCDGHWQCAAGDRCDSACEMETCSDGTCDVLGGESPFNCAADCAMYQCLLDADCAGLDLPEGCGGEYLCFERVCLPVCED